MTSIDFAKRSGLINYKRKAGMMDRRFIPRVKEFVQVLQHQPTIEEIVDYLQESFPDYGRKKRVALRQSVIKALNTTDVLGRYDRTVDLENNHLAKRQKRISSEQREDLEVSNDSDVSVNDEELVEYKDANIINNSMQNLYKSASNRDKSTAGKTVTTPVIDLTDNTAETNTEPIVCQSSLSGNVHTPTKKSLLTSPRSVQSPGNESLSSLSSVIKSTVLSSPRQQGRLPDSPRQGLQVFAKSNHGQDLLSKNKISIQSSSVQDEAQNGGQLSDDSCSEDKYDESSTLKSVIVTDEKPDLKSVVVSTTCNRHNVKTKKESVKNLIAISEDERNGSLRLSTPSLKPKGHRQKSDHSKEPKKKFEQTVSNKTFKDIGGYESCIQEVSKLLFHLKHPEVFTRIGIKPPRGFLLHGPPGCGKTLLANAIAGELGLPFYKIAATEVVSGISGDSEQRIRSLFAEAVAVAPSILFIDEIDSITPKRENAGKEMERRVVTQILTCMDELDDSQSNVLVIGATNRPDSLDPALRRAGRFDREIAMGIPDLSARKTILKVICSDLRLSLDFDFDKIAAKTPGYVGADIQALTREAALCAVDSAFKSLDQSYTSTFQHPESIVPRPAKTCGESSTIKEPNTTAWLREQPLLSEEQLSSLYISTEHFENALPHVQPSAKREGFATVPDATWDDVGALEDIREELTMSIMAPVQNPEEFESLGLITPPGILLCGPPGCGKTLLAKAVANEAGINFISVKGPELMNMYVGESEKAVRQVFQRARSSSPCVIFFDEIDALCPKRSHGDSNVSSRVVNQLLTEMDGLESRKNVFILGATNRPDILDGAILRPGRLDKQLYVGLPNAVDRAKILHTITKNGTKPSLSEDVTIQQLASDDRCEGFSGADLGALVREASVSALKEFMRKRKGLVEDEDKDGFTKFPSDAFNGPCEVVKTIVVTCPSACDEYSAGSVPSPKLDNAAQGEENDAPDVTSSSTNQITTSTSADKPLSVMNNTISSDIANDTDETQNSISSIVPKSPNPSPSERDVTKVEINEKNVTSETLMEAVDTVSSCTDSPATADFQVGSIEDNEQIVLDTSSELATEDAQDAHNVINANEKQSNQNSVLTPPSKSRRIMVSRKHFSIAFSKVKPSVSDKDRIWYEKMKLRNSDR